MRYRATKDLHIGAIRSEIRAGDTVEFNGELVQLRGQSHRVPGFSELFRVGFFKQEDSSELTAPLSENPPQEPETLTFLGDSVKTTPTPPAHKNPEKPHVWESNLFGNSEKTCKVCGVTQRNPLDRDLGKPSLGFRYSDAYGVSINSMKELPCPVFVGDFGGAIASGTYRTRKLTGKVETIDERVTRLELENLELHARADKRQEVALDLLSRLVSAAERLVELGDSQVGLKLLVDKSEIIDVLEFETVPPLTKFSLSGKIDDLP